jgi:DNA-binding NtrC family response regulator
MDRDAAPFFSGEAPVKRNDERAAGRTASPHASDRARRRRLAAEERAEAACVLVCESREDGTSPVRTSVRALGFTTVPCSSLDDALRASAKKPFDVVIVVMERVDAERISLLQLLRRSLPSAPLVIVSEDGSLEARALCQPVRPYYFAVPPVPEGELRAILSGAVEVARRS